MELPLRLSTDWLVVVDRSGRRVEPEDLATIRAPVGPWPTAGDPLVWTDRAGGVGLAAWPRERLDRGSPWHLDETGVALARGQLRRRGRSWTHPGDWAVNLTDPGEGGGGRHPLEGLLGDGTVVSLRADGTGILAADQLGAASVFAGRSARWDVFASRPALAALAPERGHLPTRDTRAAAWMAYAGHVIGDSTGHRGVRRLPVGSRVDIGPGGAGVLTSTWPWLDHSGLVGVDRSGLIDRIEASILDQLQAAIDLGGEPVLDLTGGKDSRVLLAIVLHHLDIERFRVRTVGGPESGDVRVAADIARRFGFRHECDFPLRPTPETFSEKCDRFIACTDGVFNAWSMRVPRRGGGVVRISATMAETMRFEAREADWRDDPTRPLHPTAGELAEYQIERLHRLGAGFLQPDVQRELDDEVRTMTEEDPCVPDHGSDYLGSYYIRHLGRRLGGTLLEFDEDHRVMAMADINASRAAYAMGTRERQYEAVHQALLARTVPELATLPFHDSTWARPVTAPAAPDPPPPPSSPPPTPPEGPGRAPVTEAGWASLFPEHHARPQAERRDFLTETLSDPANPVWDFCRRDRVLDALARLDGLSTPERQQLYGLATGARWLAG